MTKDRSQSVLEIFFKKLKCCKNGDVGSKGYKMFSENYVHNSYTSDNTNWSYFATGICHPSQRKNAAPHKMPITVEGEQGICEVGNSFFTCKAGSESLSLLLSPGILPST